jgi:hypothetical protein
MIHIDVPQGSPEWIAARIGIPTASCFDQILTPRTLKLSASADNYMHLLLAEWMLGASLDSYVSEWMQRGKDLEDQAISYYELQRDIETEKVGFLMHDDLLAGCSPDRLVGDDGGLEIKCPSPARHVANLLEMTNQYRAQVQGALWITGRKWWDLMSFHPDMPTALVRFERDEEFILALESAVNAFAQRMIEARQTMVDRGYIPQTVKAA